MPWWAWAVAVPFVLFMLLWLARRAFRRAVRREFVSFLQETMPGVKVKSESEGALVVEVNGSDGTFHLWNLYSAAAAAPATPEGRRDVFSRFADGARQAEADATLRLETHGDRIRPRLLSASMLSGMPAEVARAPVPGTPLHVVYVLDSESSVQYLTDAHLKDLGLDAAGVHDRALQNLKRVFPPDPVRDTILKKTVTMVKTGDTYDAARLLLVPGYLQEGEVLAAGVPDRDTLFLTAPPPDGDWSAIQKLARAAAGPQLLDRTLRVTRAGFETP